jgi:hypothetical protein
MKVFAVKTQANQTSEYVNNMNRVKQRTGFSGAFDPTTMRRNHMGDVDSIKAPTVPSVLFNYDEYNGTEETGMGMIVAPRSYVGVSRLSGLGAVDANGNPQTLDAAGDIILNYADGYPTTDANGAPLPDPLTVPEGTFSPAGSNIVTPAQTNASTLISNVLTSFLSTFSSPATPAAGAAAAPSPAMSSTTKMAMILGLGGIVAWKLLKKR